MSRYEKMNWGFNVRIANFALLLLFFSACSRSTVFGWNQYSLSSQVLSKILEKQKNFLNSSLLAKTPNETELTRKAQEIGASYESYLSDNPKDTDALILFGKFLIQVGQKDHAVNYFLEADALNSKLAVVKQQIGNYLVEKNRPLDALPFFMLTIEIDPQQPVYHYHFANYLYLFQEELLNSGVLNKDSLRSVMQSCFEKASELKPENFEYAIRYAQSFFDCPNTCRVKAVQSWQNLILRFPDRSPLEKDYFKLCKANILLQMNLKAEALTLVKSIATNSLENAKLSLIERIRNSEKKNPDVNLEKPIRFEKKSGFYLQDLPEPHLERLFEVTNKLKEERLLTELKVDVIKAHLKKNGDVKLEVSNQTNSKY